MRPPFSRPTTAAILLALILFGLAPAPTARAAIYTVNSANDADDGTCDATHCSLREAINAANAAGGADTITFGVSGTITLGSALPTITSAGGVLTVDGSGQTVTISGNNTVRVFYVDVGASLTLQNLTVANGAATGSYGGGVYNAGGTVVITNCTFSGNSAAAGGGVFNFGSGASLTITNSVFSNNSGSAVHNGDGTVVISSSTFSGNSGVDGGGVANLNGSLTITGSSFSGNSGTNSSTGGGGVYTTGSTAVIITGSSFSGNSGNNGGGLGIGGGSVTVTNSTFSGNSAVRGGGLRTSGGGATIINSTFSGNSASIIGGGISHYSSTRVMSVRNTIVANSASGGNCDVTFSGTLVNDGNNIDSGTTCGWGSNSGSLSNTDPLLGALTGSPAYFPLNTGSPAIDAVIFNAPNNCPANDQRGAVRPQGAYCDVGSYETIVDLTATKTNNSGGTAYVSSSFNWTITVQNTGAGAVSFTDGQTILEDALPVGPTYGAPTVQNVVNVTNSANIQCVMFTVFPGLTCSAGGATVTLGAATGRFDVVFSVAPNATGTLTNPTGGGVCRVDPAALIAENSEANNDCADTVTVANAGAIAPPPTDVPPTDVPPTGVPPTAVPPPTVQPTVFQGVGASGGTFTGTGAVTVTIPANIVPEGSTLRIAPPISGAAPQPSAAFKLFGEPINIEIVDNSGATLRTFNTPLTICISYTDADVLAAGGDVNNFVMQTAQIGGTWAPLPTTVDTTAKKVCATVNHLTLFALTARAPTILPVTGGDLTPGIAALIVGLLVVSAAGAFAVRRRMAR